MGKKNRKKINLERERKFAGEELDLFLEGKIKRKQLSGFISRKKMKKLIKKRDKQFKIKVPNIKLVKSYGRETPL